jgi:hypothetical protein
MCRHIERRRQVMLDLDSTVFPLVETMGPLIGRPDLSPADCPTWDSLMEHCGGLPGLKATLAKVFVFDVMAAAGAYPGAVQTAVALREHGIRIHVVTHRPEACEPDTRRYLEAIGLPFDVLVVHPTIDKVAYCVENGIEVLVDDHPKLISDASAAGLSVCALRFPYNLDALAGAGLSGAESWSQLCLDVLDAVEARVCAGMDVEALAEFTDAATSFAQVG